MEYLIQLKRNLEVSKNIDNVVTMQNHHCRRLRRRRLQVYFIKEKHCTLITQIV